MAPDISVIIPTYRRPGPLVEAIESVLAQKGANCEILVIDDCPEGSAEEAVRTLCRSGRDLHALAIALWRTARRRPQFRLQTGPRRHHPFPGR